MFSETQRPPVAFFTEIPPALTGGDGCPVGEDTQLHLLLIHVLLEMLLEPRSPGDKN